MPYLMQRPILRYKCKIKNKVCPYFSSKPNECSFFNPKNCPMCIDRRTGKPVMEAEE